MTQQPGGRRSEPEPPFAVWHRAVDALRRREVDGPVLQDLERAFVTPPALYPWLEELRKNGGIRPASPGEVDAELFRIGAGSGFVTAFDTVAGTAGRDRACLALERLILDADRLSELELAVYGRPEMPEPWQRIEVEARSRLPARVFDLVARRRWRLTREEASEGRLRLRELEVSSDGVTIELSGGAEPAGRSFVAVLVAFGADETFAGWSVAERSEDFVPDRWRAAEKAASEVTSAVADQDGVLRISLRTPPGGSGDDRPLLLIATAG